MVKIHIKKRVKVKQICDFPFNASFQLIICLCRREMPAMLIYLQVCRWKVFPMCWTVARENCTYTSVLNLALPLRWKIFTLLILRRKTNHRCTKQSRWRCFTLLFDLKEMWFSWAVARRSLLLAPAGFGSAIDNTPLAEKYHDLQVCKCSGDFRTRAVSAYRAVSVLDVS